MVAMDGHVSKEYVLQLIRKKDDIEAAIKTYQDVLKSQKNVGMQEPLVDPDGYPRNDIDVYLVRQARNRIICLQNDHKAAMNEIEKALHTLHARESNKVSPKDIGNTTIESHSWRQKTLNRPFAKVDAITPGSPAEEAGLQVDDLIVEFGSVNANNFNALQNIASVVQHSIGQLVNISVYRENSNIHLTLIPKQWKGRGLLGCNIAPILQ